VTVLAEPDERSLVAALRRGETSAFDEAYAAYEARIFSFLLRLSGRRDTAEDLTQETWIRFAKAARGLDENTRLAPYLFTIARNLFVSHRRWAMLDLSRIVMLGQDALVAVAGGPLPDALHEESHKLAELEAALLALPVASREILLLVGVEGLDQEEAARILGISYDASRQRLSRARAQLGEQLRKVKERGALPRPRARDGESIP
jgi:RNA polymerase sigma factor (sigma-70 family)